MTYKPKFYWDEETVDAFKFDAKYQSYSDCKYAVEDFVMDCCSLEDGETEEDLVRDLLNLIYSDYDQTIG
jgi:hypothetical protein